MKDGPVKAYLELLGLFHLRDWAVTSCLKEGTKRRVFRETETRKKLDKLYKDTP